MTAKLKYKSRFCNKLHIYKLLVYDLAQKREECYTSTHVLWEAECAPAELHHSSSPQLVRLKTSSTFLCRQNLHQSTVSYLLCPKLESETMINSNLFRNVTTLVDGNSGSIDLIISQLIHHRFFQYCKCDVLYCAVLTYWIWHWTEVPLPRVVFRVPLGSPVFLSFTLLMCWMVPNLENSSSYSSSVISLSPNTNRRLKGGFSVSAIYRKMPHLRKGNRAGISILNWNRKILALCVNFLPMSFFLIVGLLYVG